MRTKGEPGNEIEFPNSDGYCDKIFSRPLDSKIIRRSIGKWSEQTKVRETWKALKHWKEKYSTPTIRLLVTGMKGTFKTCQ